MNRIGQVLCIESSDLSLTAKANFTGRAATDESVVVANWSADKGYEYASGLAEDIVSVAKNTGIVDELYKQLEEGTGNDKATPWSQDGAWYFEAFDGLTIAKFETTLSVGFIDPYERTSVLDPEVVPSMQNKSVLHSTRGS